MMKSDISDLSRYLNETLGISVIPKPLASASGLLYFLQKGYSLFEAKILDHACIFVVDRSEQEQPPAIILPDDIRLEPADRIPLPDFL